MDSSLETSGSPFNRLSDRFPFFGRLRKKETKIPESLTGQEVASMVEECYEQLPISLGSRLVDSNVVLTLAGFKPMTEFFIPVLTDEVLEEIKQGIEKANTFFKKMGIKLAHVGKPFNKPTGAKERTQMVSIASLLGSERISKTTQMPGISHFDHRNGFEGLRDWHNRTWDELEQNQAQNKIPPEYALQGIVAGINRGYPDRAILDFADWIANGRTRKMQDSNIPHTGTYQEAQPNYDFYPEHADNPAIRQNIDQAGKILADFYQSSWHQRISQEQSFKQIRRLS